MIGRSGPGQVVTTGAGSASAVAHYQEGHVSARRGCQLARRPHRTYVLRLTAASIGLDEAATMSTDEHRQAFLAYVAGLLDDLDRYLARGRYRPAATA